MRSVQYGFGPRAVLSSYYSRVMWPMVLSRRLHGRAWSRLSRSWTYASSFFVLLNRFSTFSRHTSRVVPSLRRYITVYRRTSVLGIVMRTTMVRVSYSTNYRFVVYRARLHVARSQYPLVGASSVLGRVVVRKANRAMGRLLIQSAQYCSARVGAALYYRYRYVYRLIYGGRV